MNVKELLNKSVLIRGLQLCFFLVLETSIFFISAGRTDLPLAWLYFIMYFILIMITALLLLNYSPSLIMDRSEVKKGTKSWDKIFSALYGVLQILTPAVAGLDVGRYHLSYLGINFFFLGIILFVFGGAILIWSMLVNKFFEPTVRIQKEKNHTVVINGPYGIVRHPGYVGMVLLAFSLPLIIGSFFALIPAAILLVLFIIRTYLEDKTLREELTGYEEYTKKVKYRLVPRVW